MSRIACLPWESLGAPARQRWRELRRSNAALASPFFSWDFADAVARRRGGVEVGVVEDGSTTLGYFAFERRDGRHGVPVGSPMNDYQGVIVGPTLAFDPRELLVACRLTRFEYDHVVVEQEAWAPFHAARRRSPCLDLRAGHRAWLHERQRAGHSALERLQEKERALERAHGPLRFEWDCREEGVLRELLGQKSAQYRRTLGPERDLFADPAMRAVVMDLFQGRSEDSEGVLSALWAGDHLVAGHFGIGSRPVLHWWFPAYDPRFARWSPGALLLRRLVKAAPDAAYPVIDFGKGEEPYKLRWANGAREVAEGRVELGAA